MSFHPFARCIHLFQKEKDLREILLEIEDIRKDQLATIKHHSLANQTISKWADHQPENVKTFLQQLLQIENEIHTSEAEYTKMFVEFKALWKDVLAEKVELADTEEKYKFIEKDWKHTEKNIAECHNTQQLELLKKHKADLDTAKAKLHDELGNLTLQIQQQVEIHLRNAYLKLGQARMKYYEESAALQEKYFQAFGMFKQTSQWNLDTPPTLREFEEKLPSLEFHWNHGKEYLAKLQYQSTSDSPVHKLDVSINEEMLLIGEAKKYLQTDRMEFIMARLDLCFQAIDALKTYPTVVTPGFVESTEIISRGTSIIIFATDAICATFLQPQVNPSKLLSEVAEAGCQFCAQVSSSAKGTNDMNPVLEKAEILRRALEAIKTHVKGLPFGFTDVNEQTAQINKAKLVVNSALESLKQLSLSQAQNEHVKDIVAIQALIGSGSSFLLVAQQILDQTIQIQESKDGNCDQPSGAASVISSKNWARSMRMFIDSFLENVPVWMSLFSQLVEKQEKYDEVQVATNNLSATAAQLSYFTQVLPSVLQGRDNHKATILSLMEQFIQASHSFNKLVSETRTINMAQEVSQVKDSK